MTSACDLGSMLSYLGCGYHPTGDKSKASNCRFISSAALTVHSDGSVYGGGVRPLVVVADGIGSGGGGGRGLTGGGSVENAFPDDFVAVGCGGGVSALGCVVGVGSDELNGCDC